MLRIDESRDPALLLRLGDKMEGQRRLAARFRTIDLDDPTARKTADPERDVERQGTGWDDADRLVEGAGALVPKAHDRALAELFLDSADCGLDRLAAVRG